MKEKKIKYSVWFRVYINGRECFATKSLVNVVLRIHQILDSFATSEDYSFELRRLVYVAETGAVVSNVLVSDKIGDLI